MAIENAKGKGHNPKNGILYTTLEPCVYVGKGKTKSCSELLIDEKIKSVVIGSYEPNSKIRRKGWKVLRDAGIQLYDVEKDLHEEVIEKNKEATDVFIEGYGPSNGARFDYKLNDGKFVIRKTKESTQYIATRWTLKGINGIYAYAVSGVKVAKVDFATSFDDIDETHQFDFESTSVAVYVGEICIFINKEMTVLVKIEEVKSGVRFGPEETALKIKW